MWIAKLVRIRVHCLFLPISPRQGVPGGRVGVHCLLSPLSSRQGVPWVVSEVIVSCMRGSPVRIRVHCLLSPSIIPRQGFLG
jgi:hypothetical protein